MWNEEKSAKYEKKMISSAIFASTNPSFLSHIHVPTFIIRAIAAHAHSPAFLKASQVCPVLQEVHCDYNQTSTAKLAGDSCL